MFKIKIKISKVIERKAFPIFFLYKYIKHIKTKFILNKIIKKNNLNYYSNLKVKDYKTSDSLFILGSGSSINNFGKKEWDIIRSNDSIGFNFWLIHDFIPDFYMFEPPRNESRFHKLLKLLDIKKSKYSEIPFLLKDFEKHQIDFSIFPNELKSNFYVPYKFSIPGNEKKSFLKSLIYIKKFNIFKKKNIQLFKRASLSQIIFFAFKHNYKNIILCGIDLNNANYFYEDKYYTNLNLPIPSIRHKEKNVHKTFNKNQGEITIDLFVRYFNKYFLEPSGITLYIGSKSSALYPELEFYFEN